MDGYRILEFDNDSVVYVKTVHKPSAEQYKELRREARVNTTYNHCHHSYDCCGCVCRTYGTFRYNRRLEYAILTYSETYNY